MDNGQKTSDRANCKGQLILTLRGERRLRRVVCRQQSQTLAQITTQLNEDACHSTGVTVWVSGTIDLREYYCSILTIRLHVLPGQESTETGVLMTGKEYLEVISLYSYYLTPAGG
ncbi:hypothetical protein TNCV_3326891 [Trichonephila clavipes]|nr:hypothetical protein TNCV_3326891 [Trichonephila clavipes]